MKSTLAFCALLLFALLSQPAIADVSEEQSEQIENTVSALMHTCEALYPSFSSDKKSVAFISNLNGSRQVWTVPAEGGFPQLVTIGDTSVPYVAYSPTDNNCIAFSTWPKGTNNYQVYTVRPDGTGLKRITPGGNTKTFGGFWTKDGKSLRVSSDLHGTGKLEPGLLDLAGSFQPISDMPAVEFEDLSENRRFALIARATGNQNLVPYIADLQKRAETPLMPGVESQHFYGRFSPDARSVYIITRANRDRDVFGVIHLDENGKPGEFTVLAEQPGRDLQLDTSIQLISPDGNFALLDWRTNLDLLELPSGKKWTVSRPPHVGSSYFAFSNDSKQAVMVLCGDFVGEDVWTLDLASREFKQITFLPHPGIDFKQLIRPEKVTFNTFDGLELNGWLYRPAPSKELPPYIINFHGGPESEASAGREFQPLLEQGIGVFAPNVRGSSGRGKEFAALDNGALRENAIKDIKSCVQFLLDNKIADQKRIGIMGHSYGGYMALAGLTTYPELFAAGMDYSGPLNLVNKLQSANDEWGDPATDSEFLKRLSPANYIDKVRAPVMIVQGEKDDATSDAEKVVEQLKLQKIPVTYLVYPEEGHNLWKINNKIQAGVETVKFFVKYLKPSPPG